MKNSAMLPPTMTRLGPLRWLKENLFSTWYNTLLTLAALSLIYYVGGGLLVWALTQAKWAVIPANLQILMIGTYPIAQAWRVWMCLYLVCCLLGLSAGVWTGLIRQIVHFVGATVFVFALIPFGIPTQLWVAGTLAALVLGFLLGLWGERKPFLRWTVLVGWILSFPVVVILLHGFSGSTILPLVETVQWGGFLLTLMLALVGMCLSFPLGVLLALGRRSSLPVIRIFCTLYIEVVRGVPLITVLFMASVMLPLFLPPGWTVDNVVRAMIGLTLFTAAYIAENVRGGLQSVPKGQVEAASALGLSRLLTTFLIVLPQALRVVIPANVGQFISLFKDTSLVSIVGLLEVVNIGNSVISNPDWLGLVKEVFLFIALLYFTFSYAMSYISRRLEKALGVGER